LAIGGLLGALTYLWKSKLEVLAALICLLLSAISAVAYQAATMLPELIKLKNLEREVADPFLARFDDDVDLIQELSAYDERHLHYAQSMFEIGARQMRERIGVLVGALDKVGIVPFAVTSYVTYLRTVKDGLQPFGGSEWVGVAFLALFLFAARMISVAQWMEQVACLYAEALARRTESKVH
jgi:hypothetical protein